jgi:beta-galactosidase
MIVNTKRLHLSMNKEWKFISDIKLPRDKQTIPNPYDVEDKDVYNNTKAGGKQGVPQADFDTRSWEKVNLPHDFLIGEPFDPSLPSAWGYKPRGTAWYRKSFVLPDEFSDKKLVLHFEGVLTNCEVYFNGSRLMRHFSGYAPFTVDITDRVFFGSKPNVLAVFVDANAFEGWWYEGGGIYRPVWLDVINKASFADEPHITVKNTSHVNWSVSVRGIITGVSKNATVKKTIYDPYDAPIITFESETVIVKDPEIWDIDNPVLYTLKSELIIDGVTVDEYISTFGFRTINMTADKGFFLNGKNIKLYGMCNHQDFAGVGAAMTDSLWLYKISRLKEMGANAYRSAHGMASDGLVRACDRLGMLLMDENRNFESTDEVYADLRAMVNRDYNHPSVIMYSICNEEPLQSAKQGQNIAIKLRDEILQIDNTRYITGAMNGGVLDDDGFAAMLDVAGINYQPQSYDKYHEKNPLIPMVGAETTSYFSTRGESKTDINANVFDCFDESKSRWGNSVRETWTEICARDFMSGGFVWTGFDYLGEPTPCQYPAVSSYFGMMDSCGFPKGGYYISKAIFAKEPYVRFIPDYDGNPGEEKRLMSATNCPSAELFINGISKGIKQVDKFKQVFWEFPFEAGEARIVGYSENGKVISEFKQRSPENFFEIKLNPFFDVFDENTELIPITITAVDKNGIYCPNVSPVAEITVESGYIAGSGNGDPCCHEDFKGNIRTLFHGKALVIVGADDNAVFVKVNITVDKKTVGLTIPRKNGVRAFIPTAYEIYVDGWRVSEVLNDRPELPAASEFSDNNTMKSVYPENGIIPESVNIIGKYLMFETNVMIPESINGKPPVMIFHKIWGNHEIYINGKLVREFETAWAAEQQIIPETFGDTKITVICKSTNAYGTGLSSSVIIR